MVCYVSDINFKYFYYKGKTYTTCTRVRLNESYIKTNVNFHGNPIGWPYAVFSHRVAHQDGNYYCFDPCGKDSICGWPVNKYTDFFIKEGDLEHAIEEIIEPHLIELTPVTPKKDLEVEAMWILWPIYIFILFFSLVFKEFYLIWFWISVIFFKLRKKLLLE